MEQPTQSLEAENAALRAELERLRAQAREQERRLDSCTADLSVVSERERQRTDQLHASYRATVRSLANAVEARDAYTGRHAERVAAYGMEVARSLGSQLTEQPEIEFGFLLHDIGKVAIPDAILFKPEPLTLEEYRLMERHTVIGAEILRGIEFLGAAKSVVRSHHERWDGAGYPDGLAGEKIPFAARVFSVADTLDALTTERPYRPAVTLSTAREVIRGGAGSQFDPDVVAAFSDVGDAALEAIRAA
jgi:putative nucleotidyltransferase with HDIG domain